MHNMMIEIDFNSEEALYLQLRNQIILGIATSKFQEGDALPSVRQLADDIGINMHTVNKAYTVLKQEGFVIRLDCSVVLARLPVDFGFWSAYRNVPGECVFYFRGTGEELGFRNAFSGTSGLFVLSEDSW